MQRRIAGLALTVALPVALLAACTPPDDTTRRPIPAPTWARASAVSLELPFDAFKWSPQEDWSLERARHALLERCVRSSGVGFTMPVNTSAQAPSAGYGNSRRYGVADENAASRFGYHMPVTDDELERRRAVTEWGRQVGAEEEATIYGSGHGGDSPGCYHEADSILTEGVPRADTGWLTQQSAATLQQTERNAEVVRAREKWRSCMSASGYTYRTPEEAIGDSRWDVRKPEIGRQEVETARADTRCKRGTGLTAVWHRAEAALQRRIIARNPETFRALAANKRAHLANVRDTLAG
ncbi:hypothetical protein ACWGDX_30360 [Streptomyces sp. NPDC055025]